VAAYAAEFWRFNGPNICVNTACSSGADAIALGAQEIRSGRADVMVCGAADVLSEFVFRGFSALDALTKDGFVRPFDKNRSGMALSEGSGVVIIEEKFHAQKRGAKVYGRLSGYSSTSDAYHLVRPAKNGEGLARAITLALEEAYVTPQDVGYISAHGTGTFHNDLSETNAVKTAFGDYAGKVNISSIKSMIGHSMAASSAIEAVVCLKAMQEKMIPPTINYHTPDPECDLDFTPNNSVRKEINTAISLSAGFGGQNAVLVFRKL
jgi:3-oxoacyl-(acyl-carrier-protein) synthase